MNTRTPETIRPEQPRLEPADLDAIRAGVDWQRLFTGLGLRKAERKSKPGDWWAFSPFHEEKTPSFHMGPGGIWYDFSVGEGGGAIELVQQIKRCDCYDAARLMLEMGWTVHFIEGSAQRRSSATPRALSAGSRSALPPAGGRPRSGAFSHAAQHSGRTTGRVVRAISLPEKSVDSEELPNPPIRQDLMPLCTPHALLAERGISEDTCEMLGIGFLPQGRSQLKGRIVFQIADARYSARGELASLTASARARSKDRGASMAQSSGANAPSSNSANNQLQRVILSHLGRGIAKEQRPKYLFYEGFQKSAELYGQELIYLHEDAEAQIRDTGHILLTEGPFDVAMAVEAGFRNVVGSFGAALSERQAMKLKAMAECFGISRICIAYDRDEAGRRGADKAASLLKTHNLEPVIVNPGVKLVHAPA